MADILVNEEQWKSLSKDDQDKIEKGLLSTGAMKTGDQIVGDPAAPVFDKDTEMEPLWNPIKDICKAACDVTAVLAVGWCTTNTAGLGLSVCLAAAEGIRRECRKHC